MNDIEYRTIDDLADPALAAFGREVFADYEPSPLLTEVLAAESAARDGRAMAADASALRIGAYRDDTLIAWTYGRRDGRHQFYMVNSGVAPAERRRGVYSQLVRRVIEHATSQGYTSVTSRHVASNVAVVIAKLRLGFQISGFEYSEVYGPLVALTYLIADERRKLYRARTAPLRTPD